MELKPQAANTVPGYRQGQLHRPSPLLCWGWPVIGTHCSTAVPGAASTAACQSACVCCVCACAQPAKLKFNIVPLLVQLVILLLLLLKP